MTNTMSDDWNRYSAEELDRFDAEELDEVAAELRGELRDKGNVRHAIEESKFLINYILSKDETTLTDLWRPLALLQYELGYCFYLIGEAENAGAAFSESAASSAKANHPVGIYIGEALSIYTKLLLPNPDYQAITDAMTDALKSLLAHQQKNPSDTLCGQWISNLYRDLFAAAADAGDPDTADQRLGQWKQSGIRQARVQDPNSDTGKRFRVIELSCEAQLAVIRNETKKALQIYAAYLPLPLQAWGDRDTTLTETVETTENIAKDFYLVSTLLSELGKTELALICLEAGLGTKTMNANDYYQNIIRIMLKEMDSEN